MSFADPSAVLAELARRLEVVPDGNGAIVLPGTVAGDRIAGFAAELVPGALTVRTLAPDGDHAAGLEALLLREALGDPIEGENGYQAFLQGIPDGVPGFPGQRLKALARLVALAPGIRGPDRDWRGPASHQAPRVAAPTAD